MSKQTLVYLIMVMVILTSCSSQNLSTNTIKEFVDEDLPKKVAKLSPLDISSVENFERYKVFTNKFNDLARILNEESDLFNIPYLEPTQEQYEKVSRYITEYGPLINNYNEVIANAKKFESKQNEKELQDFYMASGKFAFETAIIVGAVFYSAAYQGVGIVYRSVGMNKLALKCGTCVSVVLSDAHWFIRTVLVEGGSQAAQFILDKATILYNLTKTG